MLKHKNIFTHSDAIQFVSNNRNMSNVSIEKQFLHITTLFPYFDEQ